MENKKYICSVKFYGYSHDAAFSIHENQKYHKLLPIVTHSHLAVLIANVLHCLSFYHYHIIQYMNKYLYFCRKAFNRVIASKNESSLDYLPKRASGVFDTAHLVLRLLPSRDGIVLRKLLMTAVSEFEPEPFHEILSYFY